MSITANFLAERLSLKSCENALAHLIKARDHMLATKELIAENNRNQARGYPVPKTDEIVIDLTEINNQIAQFARILGTDSANYVKTSLNQDES